MDYRPPDVLTPLFSPDSQRSTFQYGTLIEWDSLTRENVVEVNGVQYANCPVFQPAISTLGLLGLALLLPYGNTYLIMGRVVGA